jgi:hypothetical protein
MLVKFNIETGTEKITCWRNPTAWEIKFGEGAIHYRDFTDFEIGRNKNGELKKWFKADDGLIYHRY